MSKKLKQLRFGLWIFYKTFLLLTIVACLNSCWVKRSSKQRFLKPNINTNASFRMDGYYYHVYPEKSIQGYFFYSNGSLLSTDNPRFKNSMSEIDETFRSKTYWQDYNYNPMFPPSIKWTNFSVVKDSILFERIHLWNSYPHFMQSGHLINDTTFVITREKGIAHVDIGDKKARISNDTFHFRSFYPKPDSVSFINNRFIIFR